MSFINIVLISIYAMFTFLSWLTLTCFLHDEKPEFNKSWTMSILVGASLAFVWPLSMLMLYFYEKTRSCNE